MKLLLPFCFVVILLLFYSCNENNEQSSCNSFEIGFFESKSYPFFNFFTKYPKGIKSYAVGTSLLLSEDSSFVYSTCAEITEGYWKKESESIKLYCNSKRWKNDSLHLNGFNGEWPSCNNNPISFVISCEELYLIEIVKDTTDKYITILSPNK